MTGSAPHEHTRRPSGALQVTQTSTSGMSAGFAGASSSNRAGTRTSLVGGLSSSSESITRTHCVQLFEIDYKQEFSTAGRVAGLALDTVGGVALIVAWGDDADVAQRGAAARAGRQQRVGGAPAVPRRTHARWRGRLDWFAHKRLPKGPPPSSAPRVHTWTASELREATGCRLLPADVATPARATTGTGAGRRIPRTTSSG
jgi:hypothetical protein